MLDALSGFSVTREVAVDVAAEKAHPITSTIPPPVTGPIVITDTIASKLAVDFLIELVEASGAPPEFDSGPIGATMTVTVGARVNERVTASDPDDRQTLSMTAHGVPAGARLRINDGHRSGKAAAHLQWRPTAVQVGDHGITFVVNDSAGRQRSGTLVITVTEPPPEPAAAKPDRQK